MKSIAWVLTCLLVACQTAPPRPEPPSANEQRLLEIDEDFDRHMTDTALPVGATTMELKELFRPKADGVKNLKARYGEFAGAGDPAAHAHAALRVGQLYLNIGCELATLEPAAPGPDVAEQMETMLAEQASPFLEKSRQAFRSGAEKGVGEYADSAAELVDVVDPTDVNKACAESQEYWLVDDRPVGKTPQKLTAEYCAKSVDATERCRTVYADGCESNDASACYALGDLDYAKDSLEAAAEHYRRGCELGNKTACRAAVLVKPDTTHREQCREGQAVACMQLGRAGGLSEVSEACKVTQGISTDADTLDACVSGDSIACWQQAAALIREQPYSLPKIATGGFGMGGILGAMNKESRAEWKTRLVSECEQRRPYACLQLGNLRAEDGEDSEPMFRRACELGNGTGCAKLADALLERGEATATNEAVEVLKASCARDHSSNCGRLSKLFREGDKVAQSDACAVAYGWQRCSPDNLFACDDLNRLFHPE